MITKDSLLTELTREKTRELLEEYRALAENSAWKHFEGVLKEQYYLRMTELLSTPLTKHDDVLTQEYTKGECATLLLITQILPNLIEYLDSVLKLGETNDDQQSSSSGPDPSDEYGWDGQSDLG